MICCVSVWFDNQHLNVPRTPQGSYPAPRNGTRRSPCRGWLSDRRSRGRPTPPLEHAAIREARSRTAARYVAPAEIFRATSAPSRWTEPEKEGENRLHAAARQLAEARREPDAEADRRADAALAASAARVSLRRALQPVSFGSHLAMRSLRAVCL